MERKLSHRSLFFHHATQVDDVVACVTVMTFLLYPCVPDMTHFTDKETGVELELEENMALLEWLANNYKSFGATLEIITDRSQEGSQFVRGFGGIGGMLR